MKKAISLFVVILLFFNSIGQEKIKTKGKGVNHVLYYESFKVLKDNQNIKHGEYKRARHISNEIIEKGQYLMNDRVGIWEFYTQIGQKHQLEQKYNYDNDSLIYFSQDMPVEYNCYINNHWQYLIPSVHPIFIGGKMSLYHKIIDNVKISQELVDKEITGQLIVSFVIDTNGNIGNCKTILGLDKECDDLIINSIINSNIKFIPAQFNGKKDKSGISNCFLFRLRETQDSKGKIQKFYFIDTPLYYNGYIRNPKYN